MDVKKKAKSILVLIVLGGLAFSFTSMNTHAEEVSVSNFDELKKALSQKMV